MIGLIIYSSLAGSLLLFGVVKYVAPHVWYVWKKTNKRDADWFFLIAMFGTAAAFIGFMYDLTHLHL